MNDTPRTDAEVFLLFKTGDDEGVPAEFARKLEHENAALRAALERWQTLATEGLVHTLPPWMAGMVKNIAEQGQKALALRKEAQP